MVRSLLFGLLLSALYSQAYARFSVVRDSIGADNTLTDGLPGGSASHVGSAWNTPGLVIYSCC
jgi:hypothetical protein